MTNLNIEEIRVRADWFRACQGADGTIGAVGLAAAAIQSAGDVPALIAEVEQQRRLLAEIQRYQPVCDPSGDALYIHNHDGIGGYRCGNTEWWNEAICGPINEQGCDACESGGDGSWRPLYIREAVTR